MNNIKIFVLIILGLISMPLLSEGMTFDLQRATLTGVNVGTSTVFINNNAYLYKPDKNKSVYRSDVVESINIRDLKIDAEYYFHITIEEIKTSRGYSEKPIAVIFISDEKPPE